MDLVVDKVQPLKGSSGLCEDGTIAISNDRCQNPLPSLTAQAEVSAELSLTILFIPEL